MRDHSFLGVHMKNKILIFFSFVLLFLQLFLYFVEIKNPVAKPDVKSIPKEQKPLPQIETNISNPFPGYLDYDKIVLLLKEWNSQSKDITEFGVYGKSTKNQDLVYLRLRNKRISQSEQFPVLVTACIHGNEPLSTATMMWYFGNILKNYKDNYEKLLETRDIYFVPVVSPDSYPHSRYVDGVDPNRNFPGLSNSDKQSVKPVASIQDLFLKIKPRAVLSGHTWGRVFLIPYGDQTQKCPDHDQFMGIVSEMGRLSNYRYIRTCDLYMANGRLNNPPIRTYGEAKGEYKTLMPIYGTEVDWYYRNNSFAVVMEFGTHQRKPTLEEIKIEYDRTNDAFLYFLEKAPVTKLDPNRLPVQALKPKNIDETFRDE